MAVRVRGVLIAVAVALAVAAPGAARTPAHTATLTLKTVKLNTTWKQSRLRGGGILIAGKASSRMTINVGWFAARLLSNNTVPTQTVQAGSKTRVFTLAPKAPVTAHVTVKGKFRKTIKIPRKGIFPGTLAGKFVLMGYARAGSQTIPIQGKRLLMRSPAEGISIWSYASPSKGGNPTAAFPKGTKSVFLRFVILRGAEPRRAPQIACRAPNGSVLSGKKGKFAVPLRVTNPRLSLASGSWHCLLKAGGKPVKTLDFRIG